MEKPPVAPQLAHVSFISDGRIIFVFFVVVLCCVRSAGVDLFILFNQHAIGKEIKIEF